MSTLCFLNHLKHLLLSANYRGHGIHSPYLYRLISMVLGCSYPFYCFEDILKPSKKKNFHEKKVMQSNEMLFRLVNDIQPKNIWLFNHSDSAIPILIKNACINTHIQYITSMKEQNIKSIPDLIIVSNPDFGTEYTHELTHLLSIMPENCIFVFNQKHTRADNFKLWKSLKNNPETTVSIDLFHTGLLFKRKEFKHKHYRIHIH